jgi:hypothetical protein
MIRSQTEAATAAVVAHQIRSHQLTRKKRTSTTGITTITDSTDTRAAAVVAGGTAAALEVTTSRRVITVAVTVGARTGSLEIIVQVLRVEASELLKKITVDILNR